MPKTRLDKAKQRGYAIANIMLAFISEFSDSERFGAAAFFYNKLSKKEEQFKNTEIEYKTKYNKAVKKNKPLPKKPQGLLNYEIGKVMAAEAWKEALRDKNIGDATISVNGIFLSFWNKEQEMLSLLYGFKESEFSWFVKSGTGGCTLQSLKVVNVLIAIIEKNLKEVERI